MKRISQQSPQRGFTLVEMLVVISIVAVLLSLVATVGRGLALQRQRAAMQSLITAFNLARQEAIIRAEPVTVCPRDDAADVCGVDYAAGWQVFADRDRDQRRDAGGEVPLRLGAPLPPGLQVTNRAGTRVAGDAVTWFPDGTARRTLTLQLCDSQTDAGDAYSLVLNGVGRARVARGEGQCPEGRS